MQVTGSPNGAAVMTNPTLIGWGSAALSTTADSVTMSPCKGKVTLASGAGTFSNVCVTAREPVPGDATPRRSANARYTGGAVRGQRRDDGDGHERHRDKLQLNAMSGLQGIRTRGRLASGSEWPREEPLKNPSQIRATTRSVQSTSRAPRLRLESGGSEPRAMSVPHAITRDMGAESRALQSRKAEPAAIYKMVARALQRSSRCDVHLDIGCGNGALRGFVTYQITRYVGADIARYEDFPADAGFHRVDLETSANTDNRGIRRRCRRS